MFVVKLLQDLLNSFVDLGRVDMTSQRFVGAILYRVAIVGNRRPRGSLSDREPPKLDRFREPLEPLQRLSTRFLYFVQRAVVERDLIRIEHRLGTFMVERFGKREQSEIDSLSFFVAAFHFSFPRSFTCDIRIRKSSRTFLVVRPNRHRPAERTTCEETFRSPCPD